MSLDTVFDRVRYEKLFVSNLYEGTDGLWRCWLRKRRNDIGKMSGIGATAESAILAALTPPPIEQPIKSVSNQFEDLLG